MAALWAENFQASTTDCMELGNSSIHADQLGETDKIVDLPYSSSSNFGARLTRMT
jgi:hypothetical protein